MNVVLLGMFATSSLCQVFLWPPITSEFGRIYLLPEGIFFFYLKTFRKLFPAPILDAIPLQLFCEHKEGDLSPGKGVLLKSPQYLRK